MSTAPSTANCETASGVPVPGQPVANPVNLPLWRRSRTRNTLHLPPLAFPSGRATATLSTRPSPPGPQGTTVGARLFLPRSAPTVSPPVQDSKLS